MKIFEPLITHCPSRSSAVVRAFAASEPAPGSVRPNAASFLPEVRSGSHCCFCAVEEDRHRAERGVRRHRDCHRRVDPRQLLDGDRVGERVGSGAAVLLRERHAHQTELGQLRYELVREAVLAVELRGDRSDPLLRELANGRPNELVLGREVEVHSGEERRVASSTIRRTP
jgi:hypothetical protein